MGTAVLSASNSPVIGGCLLALTIAWAIVCLVLYHKVFKVYYFNFGDAILKEIFFAFFAGLILAGLSLKFWYLVCGIIIIIGIVNWKKTDSKGHIALAIMLCGITAIAGIVLGKSF